jgi:hypothetical protein
MTHIIINNIDFAYELIIIINSRIFKFLFSFSDVKEIELILNFWLFFHLIIKFNLFSQLTKC